ncbi:hypothetical protein ASPWEDRAFT_102057 [Aspergillus wentii DTO 134E9]|uniref:WSC domain-containing protein n=1 Tax=Aspergillus wentii DTO 134E9 TaxID=1073089 RepID=A0A1L9S1F7_ASPWE|nr:uncharacterized protein ASPWEDRAFT_102057 [Aspergillus wentii DTO 134E9]KAI9931007.1 hypothetical protein MW887_010662 [Aspergillus wentii]OJJ40999.1 hypothetical protein ASPWEDRAFT_102057 [Aspergillus wentii DTO 134E9]
MFGFLGLGPSSRSTMILVVAILLLSHFTPVVLGLSTAAGSPCESVCHRETTNTTSSEIVCLDRQYNGTTKGNNFQSCVDCQLKSSYVDSTTQETDVQWGLYNLRYAFTSCVYGFPQQVANISSPCVVSCDTLSPALNNNLLSPDESTFDTLCGSTAFADNVIDTCQFCYNLTTTQVYLANFLESIRYNCHIRNPTGTAFDISPGRIFTQSLLPSTLAFQNSGSSGNTNLALVIALPIMGFVILVGASAMCCFFFIRWRRREARRKRHSDHLHARWHDTTITTPGNWGEYPQEYPHQQGMYSPAMYPGGYGPGFGFVDTDGHGQNVGYAKSNFAEPGVAVSTMGPSAEHEKDEITHSHAVPKQ